MPPDSHETHSSPPNDPADPVRRSRRIRYDRMVPALLVIGLVVALFVALLWVVIGSMSAHDTRTFTYRDDQRDFGFTLKIDKRLTKAQGKTLAPLSRAAVSYSAGFYDKSGPRLGGRHGDGMQISVLQMGAAITPDSLVALRPVVAEMLWPQGETPRSPFGGGSLSPSPPISPSPATPPVAPPHLRDTTINGVAGFVSDEYEQATAKATYRLVVYILFKNDEYYVLACQARSDHWAALRPIFDKAVGSFKID